MSDIEYLELGILEFEKDLEDDYNNEWLKRVVAGMKKCYQRLESIDNSNPSEALYSVDFLKDDGCIITLMQGKALEIIRQYILKSQEQEKENAKHKQLEEQIGCPLDVRCKVVCDSYVCDENGIKYKVVYIYGEHFDCEDPFDNDMGYTKMCAFDWKDYKKTWWLREDKSE